jgi:hypothetical protein
MKYISNNTRFLRFILPLILIMFIAGCEDEEDENETPAVIEFKTGEQYISEDASVSKGAVITVGIVADKGENNFKRYNVSVAYDNAVTTKTVQEFRISDDENVHYEKDVTISVRNQAGKEKFYFTISDTEGNLVQKAVTLAVE